MSILKISYPAVHNKRMYPVEGSIKPQKLSFTAKAITDPFERAEYAKYYAVINTGLINNKNEVKNEYFQLPEGCCPDEFQIEAARVINKGYDLIADAPTGTGKTAIAHYAATKNMKENKKTFYTTPLKALSNQKYNEFKSIYGEENVGILTGDRRENEQAPVLIMTTEVYRNMALSCLYGEKPDLMNNLKTVILDEFHYLDDKSRGMVWEESKMFTPEDVQIAALSATFGNPDELKGWFNSGNDKTAELVSLPSNKRSVPLVYDSIKTNSYKAEEKRMKKNIAREGTAALLEYMPSKPIQSDFKYVVDELKRKEQLPAILFLFSRNFSRDLLEYFGKEGQDLTTDKEKEEIETILNRYEENEYIGSDLDREALKKGYAIHNAGIIPKQKELIEELFQKKLVKTVIATETLAAGINMPAKTVVISSPYKPDDTITDGETSRILTANEFKQMSGRAGRRGIDTIGYVYTMPTSRLCEDDFLYLEAMDSNPLTSKYEPGYDFLSGYYKYFDDNNKLKDIFDKTFYACSDNPSEKKSKVQSLIDLSEKKTNVLIACNILKKDEDGKITPTVKSNMASKVRGYDTLTLTETISDKDTFKNIHPAAIAMAAGAIANPANPKENEITLETDLLPIFDKTARSVENVYNNLNFRVNNMFKRLGKNPETFNDYSEMISYAKGIEKPEKSTENLKREFLKQKERKEKLDKITNDTLDYTFEEVVQLLANGEIVPSKVLDRYLQITEKYKTRINFGSITDYIEKLNTEIDEQNTEKKGNKAKITGKKKIKELAAELNEAKMMEYLDNKLTDAISSNYRFIKKNPPLKVKFNFNNAKRQFYKSITKDILIKELSALEQMDKNIKSGQYGRNDIMSDCEKAGKCLNNLKNKSLEINKLEAKNGIKSEPDRYNETAAQILYTWTYLNSVNPEDTMANWEQLLKIIPPDDADEGTIYRTILQTADLLSQMSEMAYTGYKTAENEDEKNYYLDLKETTNKARSLIIKEPVEI